MRSLITSDEIVDRAARKAESWRYILRWLTVAAIVILIGVTEPMRSYLRAHVEFLWGFLAGTLAQSIPWLVDRWRWLKWFSWQ